MLSVGRANSVTIDNAKDHSARTFRFRLGALFFVTAICGCFWGILASFNAHLAAYILSFLGLGFIALSVLAVTSGGRGVSTKISLCIGIVLLSLALIEAVLGSLLSRPT